MIGKIIKERYLLKEEIGKGGMGIVYKAQDLVLDQLVAVKILQEQFIGDKNFIRSFKKEAMATRNLFHPNIVRVYDFGQEDDIYYLVMEYVEGKLLKDLIHEEAPFPPDKAIEIANQVLDALFCAHQHNVVHRDIKPQNIMITDEGKVKVMDFGLARITSGSTITYMNGFMGSIFYISPEQVAGKMTSFSSDLYAVGVLLYEMLTASFPFTGDTPVAIALKHIEENPTPPSRLNPAISRALEVVILKALAKEPEDRFQNALEMKEALENALLGRKTPFVLSHKSIFLRLNPLRNWPLFLILFFLGGGLILSLFFVFGKDEVKVPAVEGVNLEEAKNILNDAGLNYKIEKEVFSDTIPAGSVVHQKPGAGEFVKQGREIALDVSLGPALQKVPQVVGLTERQAVIDLQNQGFSLKETVRTFNPSISEGVVISQNPPAGTELHRGSEVMIVVSQGPSPQSFAMPDLRGMDLEKASVIINENNLKKGIITEEENKNSFKGEVIGQDILPGTIVSEGTTVNLTVSKGPGPSAKKATLNNILLFDDEQEHEVRVVVDDQKSRREVYNKKQNEGVLDLSFEYYDKGKLDIYLDGELFQSLNLPLEG